VGYSPGAWRWDWVARHETGWWRGGNEEREEEMSVSFRVHEDDEQPEAEAKEEEKGCAKRGWQNNRRRDGMELGVDMDMD